MAKTYVQKKRDDGSVIYRIDQQKKTGEYHLNSDSFQAKYVAKMTLHGFQRFPTGLYSNGFGFTNAGAWADQSDRGAIRVEAQAHRFSDQPVECQEDENCG